MIQRNIANQVLENLEPRCLISHILYHLISINNISGKYIDQQHREKIYRSATIGGKYQLNQAIKLTVYKLGDETNTVFNSLTRFNKVVWIAGSHPIPLIVNPCYQLSLGFVVWVE